MLTLGELPAFHLLSTVGTVRQFAFFDAPHQHLFMFHFVGRAGKNR